VKVTGCTLFVVDGGVDTGPIVDQRAVRVHDDDTVETLHERIKVEERRMLVESVGPDGATGVRHRRAEGAHPHRPRLEWRHTTGAGG
jgi:phosphoribosylglycinamide formyltransferase-1